MTNDDGIWIGRDGQKYGPYTEANVRLWLREGQLTPDTLAWRPGMTAWMPLSTFAFVDPVIDGVPQSPPPPLQSAAAIYGAAYGAATLGDEREGFPRPPSLHWFVVLLLTIVSLGLFTWVWLFVQSGWIKKIDRSSRAREMFAAALLVAFVGGFISGAFKLQWMSILGTLASTAVLITGCFSMARSLREEATRRALPLEIGGVTLFFFQMLYIQGQLTWLARWKDTGQTSPRAPKGVFWILMIFPGLIGILAAIAIPQYQNYILRTQVAEGANLARGARMAVAEYYNSHGKMPVDNAAAGLADANAIQSQYVASVAVLNGNVVVTYGDGANRLIQNGTLVSNPQVSGGQITWRCGSESIRTQYLPAACR
jgi:Tfp pilus assembly major pilin PilA